MPQATSWSAATVLSSPQALPHTLKSLLKALGPSFPANGIFVNTYYPKSHEVHFLAHATHQTAREIYDIVRLDQNRRTPENSPWLDPVYRVDNIEDDAFTHSVAPQVIAGIQSYVMVRLRLKGRHLGVACFYSHKRAAFTEAHVRQIEELRDLLSLQVGFAMSARMDERNSNLESLNQKLSNAIQHSQPLPLATLLSNTPSMHQLQPTIEQAAVFDVPVLITGESGTGKEVVAQTIHRLSERSSRPFVRVNCSAIPESLMEAELFGHEPGAFTDARKLRRGLFEEADGGTLFLDEIGELPLSMQAKLLHAVQDRRIRRIGASHEIPVNIRIISATNRNLSQLVKNKRFRVDLYYRLNVLSIQIRPLRERPEDLEPLLKLFLNEIQSSFKLAVPAETISTLLEQARQWSWPGNVRELRNTVMRSVLAMTQNRTRPQLILDEPAQVSPITEASPETITTAGSGQSLFRDASGAWLNFDSLQRLYFGELLKACRGRIAGADGAARIAGLHPNTLRSRLQKLQMKFSKKAGESQSDQA